MLTALKHTLLNPMQKKSNILLYSRFHSWMWPYEVSYKRISFIFYPTIAWDVKCFKILYQNDDYQQISKWKAIWAFGCASYATTKLFTLKNRWTLFCIFDSFSAKNFINANNPNQMHVADDMTTKQNVFAFAGQRKFRLV